MRVGPLGDDQRNPMLVRVRRMNDGPKPYGWIISQARGLESEYQVAIGEGRYRGMEEALEAGRMALYKLQRRA